MISHIDTMATKTNHPYYRPRDASTLVLVDMQQNTPRILMGKRHERHRFLPGKYVFPGGRLDPGDYRIKPRRNLDSATEKSLRTRVSGKSKDHPKALALAAVRELFEETGLLMGEEADRVPVTRSPSWKNFFSHGVVPTLDNLAFITRAVTPPGRPRRFDTRFFLGNSSQIARDIGLEPSPSNELLELAWLTMEEARALDIPPITRFVLGEVEHHLTGDLDRPIPYFRPRGSKLHPVTL